MRRREGRYYKGKVSSCFYFPTLHTGTFFCRQMAEWKGNKKTWRILYCSTTGIRPRRRKKPPPPALLSYSLAPPQIERRSKNSHSTLLSPSFHFSPSVAFWAFLPFVQHSNKSTTLSFSHAHGEVRLVLTVTEDKARTPFLPTPREIGGGGGSGKKSASDLLLAVAHVM